MPDANQRDRPARSALDDHREDSLEPPRANPRGGEPELKNVLPLLRVQLEGGDTWPEAERYLVGQGLRPAKAAMIIDDMKSRCLRRSRPKAVVELLLAGGLGALAASFPMDNGGGLALMAVCAIAALVMLAAGLLRLVNGGLSEVSARNNFWRLTPSERFLVGAILEAPIAHHSHNRRLGRWFD